MKTLEVAGYGRYTLSDSSVKEGKVEIGQKREEGGGMTKEREERRGKGVGDGRKEMRRKVTERTS